MDEYDSASINKGCFVHKPEKVKSKKSGDNEILPLVKEHVESLWSEIETKIKDIEMKIYIETFLNGIVNFIHDAFQPSLQKIQEIPAAVLVMGVNMPDHSHIFNLLEKHLHLNDIYSTVILESKKCASVPNMLQTVLFEIHKKYKEFFKLSEELPKKQEYGFAKLYEYYCSIQVASPKKKAKNIHNKTQHTPKPIVLLIQDVESFNPEILQKLIYLCKIYSGRLPIVLIFGMASSMLTLHSILPPKAICCLGLETFHSVPATKYLTRIIEEVILSPDMPFKFGPKMFRLIVDSVLYHDFSVSNLTYMLKFSMIEHLYGKTHASLCCHESEIEKRVNELSPKYLQALRELPSLKTYLENNPRFLSCINDRKILKELITGFMQKLYHDQRITSLLLRILHCLVKDLPRYPLGKQVRELYSISLEKEIFLDEGYTQSMNLLRLHSKENLMLKLEKCLNIINESGEENGINSYQVKNIKQIVKDCIERLSKLSTDDFEKNLPEPIIFQNEKITSRFQLQEKIQMSLKMKRSNFEVVLSGIVQNLNMIFKNISPPSHSPLYEIFYFDDVSAAKKHLMAVPRVTSCCTLSNPHYYLQCKCCEITSSDEVRPTMPEMSILYKLHLQSGKLINLYDWLEGFKTIVSAEENARRRSKVKSKTNDKDLNNGHTPPYIEVLEWLSRKQKLTDGIFREFIDDPLKKVASLLISSQFDRENISFS